MPSKTPQTSLNLFLLFIYSVNSVARDSFAYFLTLKRVRDCSECFIHNQNLDKNLDRGTMDWELKQLECVIAFDNRTQTVRYRHTKSSHVTDFNQSHAWIFYSERRLNIKPKLELPWWLKSQRVQHLLRNQKYFQSECSVFQHFLILINIIYKL